MPRHIPCRVDGELQTELSRWLWLVKRIRAIPPFRFDAGEHELAG
jgi:hypothetical protein